MSEVKQEHKDATEAICFHGFRTDSQSNTTFLPTKVTQILADHFPQRELTQEEEKRLTAIELFNHSIDPAFGTVQFLLSIIHRLRQQPERKADIELLKEGIGFSKNGDWHVATIPSLKLSGGGETKEEASKALIRSVTSAITTLTAAQEVE